MKKQTLAFALAALALPSFAVAQDSLLAGFTFSQFLGEGYPQVDGQTFDPVSQVVATYRGTTIPNSNVVDGIIVGNNGSVGYEDSSIGYWSFANFNTSNAIDVRADTFGILNFANSVTVGGTDMALSDGAGMMLTFNQTSTLWDIQINDTAGFTNAAGDDFTFAARGNGGAAVVEWLYNGSVFATSNIGADTFATFGYELDAGFYGSGLIQGRLVSGSVSFDNVQFNGASAVPEPSSFAALAALAGLGFAASRRRRA